MCNELLSAFEEVRKSLLQNDSQNLKKLIAEDYCGFDPNGGQHDRAMMLEA